MTTKNNTIYPITTTYKYNDTDFPINFKAEINIAEMGALIQSIVANVIDEDGYYPYLHDYSVYIGILSTFTDFVKTDVIEIDDIIKHSDITDVISKMIDINTYADIFTFVDEYIDYQKKKLANKSEFDGLISDIRKIIADVDERFIKPVDEKSFSKLIKNLGTMKLTEKGIVDALIKSKVIDKDFSVKDTKTKSNKGKIINFAGQQMVDGTELKEDEIE